MSSEEEYSLAEEEDDFSSEVSEGENSDASTFSIDSDHEPPPKKQKKTPIKSSKTTPKKTNPPKTINKSTPMEQKKEKTVKGKGKNTSPATTKQASATIPSDPKSYVKEYMQKTNRPYSVLNIYENLHRTIAKPSLIRLLDDLVKSEELVVKMYNKTAIYCYNQNLLSIPQDYNEVEEEQNIKTLEANCIELTEKLRQADKERSILRSQPTDEELESQLMTLAKKEMELKQQLPKTEEINNTKTQEQMIKKKQQLQNSYEKYRKEWIGRKRIAMDAISQIADGMETKVKNVITLCDIEDDGKDGIIPKL